VPPFHRANPKVSRLMLLAPAFVAPSITFVNNVKSVRFTRTVLVAV
jgi:hypothetical protein